LAEEGISTLPVSGVPLALRVIKSERNISRSEAFLNGSVEIQDAGSQMLADLAQPREGEHLLDLCAGGGGKALALSAASGGRAKIFAHDISFGRMKDLPERAERAGATIERLRSTDLNELAGSLDLVFVDAPCSGSGAWRRNPDAKWRLTPGRLAELTRTQMDLITRAASLCGQRGRVVYGTCSLFSAENEAIVDAFIEAHPNWRCVRRLLTRPSDGLDGFFGTVLSQGMDSRRN
ncbi:MAG: RsmB/NOP family class I SAM-dependent RNA methyltransferase, partial [Pseudomonadota bacterium]